MDDKQGHRGRRLRWTTAGLEFGMFAGYSVAGVVLPGWMWLVGLVMMGVLLAPWGSMAHAAPMSDDKSTASA